MVVYYTARQQRRTAVDNRTGLTPWTVTRWRDKHISDKVVHYSIYQPREDERLSWPGWLTHSGRLTHIRGHPSAAGQAWDRESSPYTTVQRNQPTHVSLSSRGWVTCFFDTTTLLHTQNVSPVAFVELRRPGVSSRSSMWADSGSEELSGEERQAGRVETSRGTAVRCTRQSHACR